VGKLIQDLKDLGIYEETAIIVSSDHGENQGELNVWGDHQTADHICNRIPLVVRWPGVTDAGSTDDALVNLHVLRRLEAVEPEHGERERIPAGRLRADVQGVGLWLTTVAARCPPADPVGLNDVYLVTAFLQMQCR